MADSTNVVALFVTEDDLDLSWREFDEAMTHLHRIYREDIADDLERRCAAITATRKEAAFRDLFNRWAKQPKRAAAAS